MYVHDLLLQVSVVFYYKHEYYKLIFNLFYNVNISFFSSINLDNNNCLILQINKQINTGHLRQEY